MRNQGNSWISPFVLVGILLMLLVGCTKGEDNNSSLGIVTDIDGNEYQTVTIGTQVWMTENMRTTKYRNGDAIGTTSPATLDIKNETNPKYQWAYDGNESNVLTYGRLYTWYAVNDSRNIAPAGWHVATDEEWNTLTTYLKINKYDNSGTGLRDIAKSMAAQTGWNLVSTVGVPGNDLASNNKSGFSALPGGKRLSYGSFSDIGTYGFWWNSYQELTEYAWHWYMGNNYTTVDRSTQYKKNGYSVRCVKD